MIVVRIWEGLGNQMFQYAYARMLKERTGSRVFLEGRRIYREALPEEDVNVDRECSIRGFDLSIKFINPICLKKWNYLSRKNIWHKFKYWLSQKGIGKHQFAHDHDDKFSFHERLLCLDGNVYVMGHFFHKKYIEPIREILLKEFTPKKTSVIPKELENAIEKRNTVSIHIRRGDYLYVKCAQVVNNEMKKGRYYERAIEYIKERVDNPLFLIFSDDIEWVKNNFDCGGSCMHISGMGLKDYEELALMSRCRHNIIANSTFSFWGGWLNQNKDKIVIVPKHWMQSVVPKEWIRM